MNSSRATHENAVDYFRFVFPTAANATGDLKLSRNANTALSIVETQPGAEFAKGSFWQLYNSVTFMTDHLLGKSVDNRLTNSWYGYNRNLKTKAMEKALEMAGA